MGAIRIIKNIIKNPYKCFVYATKFYYFPFMDDKKYISLLYRGMMGEPLNLDNPVSLNEKLQWLKLYDRNPIYTVMADKYEAKKYLTEKIGEKFVVPTLAIWDTVEDVNLDMLPDQFVMKCTHDSHSIIICKDKKAFNWKNEKEKIRKALKRNYYYESRQWPYKDIKPRIIVEPYLVDESGTELKDYKIFCFNGKAEYVEVDFNRAISHRLNPYDFDWNPLNFCDKSPNDYSVNIQRPSQLDKMKDIAELLSKDIPVLRVDFYSIYDDIYVGEMTFYPGSGFIMFNPPEFNEKFGKMISLEGVQK